MLGSIIGDIVGSTYEFNNIKTKQFPLFTEGSDFTDDSVLSIAIAQWLLEGKDPLPTRHLLDFVGRYPHPMGEYGTGFSSWAERVSLYGDDEPYNSCGNGSAMRVGPVGWAFDTEAEVLDAAARSARCTHNHPEGVKGAQATALCIWMARHKATKKEIREAVEQQFGYDLHFTCNDIRPTYAWEATCQGTVPQAIVAFLDGEDFEDCIRNAVSIGGDSDTLGCITGSIAEAFYGIPDSIRNEALDYLTPDLKSVVREFEDRYGRG